MYGLIIRNDDTKIEWSYAESVEIYTFTWKENGKTTKQYTLGKLQGEQELKNIGGK